MNELFKPDQVNYIFRTYLPHWRYNERIEELIRFCHQTGIEYVMLFTDAQPMAWNQLTLDEARVEAENIHRAGRRLAEAGIRFGINATYNMPCSPWDHRGHNAYDHWVTLRDGSCPHRTPCLLDPRLEDYLKHFYDLLARTGPDYIYIDDDHRYVMMGAQNTWGCYCDLHLRRFGELTGRTWARDDLHQALLADQAVRNRWIDFLGQTLVKIADTIRRAVAAVNPKIEVGLMIPCIHPLPAIGHTVDNMLTVLKGEARPLVRPCIGPYQDRDRRQIIPGLFYLEFTKHLLGDRVQYTPEIETTPFTRLSKSLTVVRFHITQSILNGMTNPALSLDGYAGDSPYLEPAYVEALPKDKPFYEAVRQLTPDPSTRKGVQLVWDFDAPKFTPGSITSPTDLYWPAFVCHDILGNLGLACTYAESPVRFLAGDTVRALPEERIKTILHQGVLLDAAAAAGLADRGYEELLGCRVEKPLPMYGAEEGIAEEFFGRYLHNYIPLNGIAPETVFELRTIGTARPISMITDHNRRPIAPGVVIHQNAWGGKVAVLPYLLKPTEMYFHHLICYYRRLMFRKLFTWMDPLALPLWVESPSDFAVQIWDDGRRLTACLTNLSYDVAEKIVVHSSALTPVAESVRYLDDRGHLIPIEPRIVPENGDWEIDHICLPFKPLIVVIDRHG